MQNQRMHIFQFHHIHHKYYLYKNNNHFQRNNKAFKYRRDNDCEYVPTEDPEKFDEDLVEITGIINSIEIAFTVYIEKIPENDLIGPLCKEIK